MVIVNVIISVGTTLLEYIVETCGQSSPICTICFCVSL
jgi:hypothetical protein